MKFIYHPEVISPHYFNRFWFGERIKELLMDNEFDLWNSGVTFGYDRQYDRTINEDGNPGEYVQVWMRVEEE